MRYLAVLVGLIILATAPVTAQTTLALRGGVGLATMSIEEAGVEPESISRIVGGLDLGVPLSSLVSLRLSGSFAQKGGGAIVEGVEVTLNLDYMQVSTLATIATPSQGGFSASVMAGPWAGYRISCDVEAALMGVNLSAQCDDSEFSEFDINTLDYGLAFGGGVEFPLLGGLRLGLDALYSLGLVGIDDDETETRHLNIQTGLVFPIG